jgi:hypothetical protein
MNVALHFFVGSVVCLTVSEYTWPHKNYHHRVLPYMTKNYVIYLIFKMDSQEVGGGRGDWMELAQDRDRWRALVSTVKNLRVP